MLVILKHELSRLRQSPLTWVVLAILQFILAWSFLVRTETWLAKQGSFKASNTFGVTDFTLVPQFSLALLSLTFILPFFCAQHFAGERQQNVWSIFASAPIARYKILLGKFFSLFVFCLAPLIFILLMSLALYCNASLDWGLLLSSSLLYVLATAAMCIIGLFISLHFKQVITSALCILAVYLFLFYAQWFIGDSNNVVLNWLSFKQHMLAAYNGILSSYDIAYFISVTFIFYVLALLKVEK